MCHLSDSTLDYRDTRSKAQIDAENRKTTKMDICKFCQEVIPENCARLIKVKKGNAYEIEYEVCMACEDKIIK